MAEDVKILQVNKKAFFNYETVEELECGMALEGTEVKSIRAGKFSFADSYVKVMKDGLVLVGFAIQSYDKGSVFNHDTYRERRLLAHKMQVKKFRRKVEEKGYTVVPTKVYLKGNLVKMEVALARGKDARDKKNAIKTRELEIAAKREAQNYRF